MIQEIKVTNYLSFRDETTLSFEATDDTSIENVLVVEPRAGTRLLRLALVYGANASGKTNLLLAMHYLRNFWFNIPKNSDENTRVIPFHLDENSINQPTEFQITFFVGSDKYMYEVSLTKKQVFFERLSYDQEGNDIFLPILNRELIKGATNIHFNEELVNIRKEAVIELEVKCLPNMSVFAAWKQVNIPETAHINQVSLWMEKQVFPCLRPNDNAFNLISGGIKEELRASFKSYLLEAMHQADFNITGFNQKEEEIEIPEGLRRAIIKDREDVKQVKMAHVETEFIHTILVSGKEKQYSLPEGWQSDGTQRLMNVEAAIYRTTQSQGFLPIDEIDASLHPELIELILERFLESGGQSQLLITTHYLPLLMLIGDLLRTDCVWFTSKDQSGNTELYSMAEFEGLDEIQSHWMAYKSGMFGALPHIKHSPWHVRDIRNN